jgi:hypothetical protein
MFQIVMLKTKSAQHGAFFVYKIIRKSHKNYIKTDLLRGFNSRRRSVPPKLLGAAPTGLKPVIFLIRLQKTQTVSSQPSSCQMADLEKHIYVFILDCGQSSLK